MSETFTQSAEPTHGLQPYDQEGGVKNLYPATQLRLRSRKRRRSLYKDSPMTNPTIDAMVDTLAKSVAGIAVSDDRDALLAQTFSEFKAALAPEMEKLATDYVEVGLAKRDEPMFKGLGTVGRVADLVGMVSDRIDSIKSGGSEHDDEEDMDPASEDVSDFLDHMLAFGELALRSSVNEHVDLTDPEDAEEEVAKGMNIIAVPNAEAPDDE